LGTTPLHRSRTNRLSVAAGRSLALLATTYMRKDMNNL